MFDAPADAWYVWIGVALASTVAVGLATSLPRAPPPDAAGVADTVDTVAAADHATTAGHPIAAERVKVGPYRVWLRDDAATGHASFAYGPVAPVSRDTALWDVLRGTPPDAAFGSPTAFRRAVAAARDRTPEWRSVDELTVRAVSWEGVDVTLVG
ncbi:DUF7283 family protein [Halorussus marinus]|uniref:DUF7283 family protein n=1 Tax=Halorussus marinus TaxID=2505976 RepID=UPI00106E899B|nr:hypothetical protein [Halorussus marinus]